MPSSRSSDPLHTISLSDKDKLRLVSAMNQVASKAHIRHDRRALRVQYFHQGCEIQFRGEGSQDVRYAIIPRNLSRLGMGFVHGRFVYPETKCDVTLIDLEEQTHWITGRVSLCRHVQGIVHEVAVVFDRPLDIANFVHLDDTERKLYEREASYRQGPAQIVVFDESQEFCQPILQWAHEVGFEAKTVSELKELLMYCQEHPCDMIVAGDSQRHRDPDFPLIVKRSGIECPLLLIVGEEPERFEEAANKVDSMLVIDRFDVDALSKAAASLLGRDVSVVIEPIRSSLIGTSDLWPVIDSYITHARSLAESLAETGRMQDYDHLSNLVSFLRDTSSSMGLDPISELAEQVVEAVDPKPVGPKEIEAKVAELIDALHRLRRCG